MSAYELVRRAVVEKKRVHAVFDSHPRQMCPHVVGTKNGRAQALFFQFAGSGKRGLPPGGDWRCMPLDLLTEISIHDGPWRTRDFSPDQTCVDEVDAEVRL
jgi:hypothetical protein